MTQPTAAAQAAFLPDKITPDVVEAVAQAIHDAFYADKGLGAYMSGECPLDRVTIDGEVNMLRGAEAALRAAFAKLGDAPCVTPAEACAAAPINSAAARGYCMSKIPPNKRKAARTSLVRIADRIGVPMGGRPVKATPSGPSPVPPDGAALLALAMGNSDEQPMPDEGECPVYLGRAAALHTWVKVPNSSYRKTPYTICSRCGAIRKTPERSQP